MIERRGEAFELVDDTDFWMDIWLAVAFHYIGSFKESLEASRLSLMFFLSQTLLLLFAPL